MKFQHKGYLKSSFSTGYIPTQTNFHDLIDGIPDIESIVLNLDALYRADKFVNINSTDIVGANLFQWLADNTYKIIYLTDDLDFTGNILDGTPISDFILNNSNNQKVIQIKNAKIIIDHRPYSSSTENEQIDTTITLNTRLEFINCEIISNGKALIFNQTANNSVIEFINCDYNGFDILDPSTEKIQFASPENVPYNLIFYNSKIKSHYISCNSALDIVWSNIELLGSNNIGADINFTCNLIGFWGGIISGAVIQTESISIKYWHSINSDNQCIFNNCNLLNVLNFYGSSTNKLFVFNMCTLGPNFNLSSIFNVTRSLIDINLLYKNIYLHGIEVPEENIATMIKTAHPDWQTAGSSYNAIGGNRIRKIDTSVTTLSLDDTNENLLNYTIKFYDKQKNLINNFEIKKFRFNIADVNNYQISDDKTTISFSRPKNNAYIELCFKVYFPELDIIREYVHILSNDENEDLKYIVDKDLMYIPDDENYLF